MADFSTGIDFQWKSAFLIDDLSEEFVKKSKMESTQCGLLLTFRTFLIWGCTRVGFKQIKLW